MFVTFQKIQTDTWRRVKQVIIGAGCVLMLSGPAFAGDLFGYNSGGSDSTADFLRYQEEKQDRANQRIWDSIHRLEEQSRQRPTINEMVDRAIPNWRPPSPPPTYYGAPFTANPEKSREHREEHQTFNSSFFNRR